MKLYNACVFKQANKQRVREEGKEREKEEERKQSMQHFAAQNLRVLQLPY